MYGVGVTLVDRKSGYLSACPVKRRTRRQVMRAINLSPKGHVVHTLTLDNGKEFAGHERIVLKSQTRSILPTRIYHGSAVPMKIPTVCCGNISPNAPTSAS
ncbi:MAG: hypothetical protein ACI9EB_000294 [Pseudomonas sp.]